SFGSLRRFYTAAGAIVRAERRRVFAWPDRGREKRSAALRPSSKMPRIAPAVAFAMAILTFCDRPSAAAPAPYRGTITFARDSIIGPDSIIDLDLASNELVGRFDGWDPQELQLDLEPPLPHAQDLARRQARGVRGGGGGRQGVQGHPTAPRSPCCCTTCRCRSGRSSSSGLETRARRS